MCRYGLFLLAQSHMAHWCVISHGVGVMDAPGVSQVGFFPTSHSTPALHHTDGRKGWQKYHEIQLSEVEKVSYNKSQ